MMRVVLVENSGIQEEKKSKRMNIQISQKRQHAGSEGDSSSVAFRLNWLGQAGFDIRVGGRRIMIDPYLSDHLAKKYAGKEFAHQRMMPSPLKPDEITGLDYLFCTHRHSDHIDPETAPVIMRNNPECIMIAPRAEREHVLSLGIPEERVVFTTAGERMELGNDIGVTVVQSAHEEIKTDSSGNHHFLGYIFTYNGVRIYHSGDCAPFSEQADLLTYNGVDIAMLPINGRDEFRAERGVPGNMGFDEAVSLCRETGIKYLICHHFGMFDFNTADMEHVKKQLDGISADELEVVLPDIETEILVEAQEY